MDHFGVRALNAKQFVRADASNVAVMDKIYEKNRLV